MVYSPNNNQPKQKNTFNITSAKQPKTPLKQPQKSYNWLKTENNQQMPNNYNELPNPDFLNRYSRNQANRQFENQRLGYDQNIERYQNQLGNLRTDQQIEERQQRLNEMKYLDAFTGIDNEQRQANANFQDTRQDLGLQFQKVLDQINNAAFNQKEEAKSSVNQRGLINSSILDNSINRVNEAQLSGLTEIGNEYQKNIARLDRDIDNTMQYLAERRTNLTRQQQAELVDTINEMTRERDARKSELELMIDQQNQNINNARSGIVDNEQQMYLDLFNRYAGLHRQDRDFAEQQRQFNESQNLQRELASLRSSGGGGGGDDFPPLIDPNAMKKEEDTKTSDYKGGRIGTWGTPIRENTNTINFGRVGTWGTPSRDITPVNPVDGILNRLKQYQLNSRTGINRHSLKEKGR